MGTSDFIIIDLFEASTIHPGIGLLQFKQSGGSHSTATLKPTKTARLVLRCDNCGRFFSPIGIQLSRCFWDCLYAKISSSVSLNIKMTRAKLELIIFVTATLVLVISFVIAWSLLPWFVPVCLYLSKATDLWTMDFSISHAFTRLRQLTLKIR